MSLSDEQAKFVQDVLRAPQGTQFSLSGGGGSGKSFTINALHEKIPDMLRCAATGTASTLVDGVTFHSLFVVPVGPPIDPDESIQARKYRLAEVEKMGWGRVGGMFPKKRLEVLKYARVVVVDEVSMIRCDAVDWADKISRHARKQPQLPFGGLTIIWAGDMGQLSVITTEGDREILNSYGYERPYGLTEAKVFRDES